MLILVYIWGRGTEELAQVSCNLRLMWKNGHGLTDKTGQVFFLQQMLSEEKCIGVHWILCYKIVKEMERGSSCMKCENTSCPVFSGKQSNEFLHLQKLDHCPLLLPFRFYKWSVLSACFYLFGTSGLTGMFSSKNEAAIQKNKQTKNREISIHFQNL